jgi:hypothetical protein
VRSIYTPHAIAISPVSPLFPPSQLFFTDEKCKVNDTETAFVRPIIKKKSNGYSTNEDAAIAETPESPSAHFTDTDFPALGSAPGKQKREFHAYINVCLSHLYRSGVKWDYVCVY